LQDDTCVPSLIRGAKYENINFGAGSIGAIYGYFLSKADNNVIHYVRENRVEQLHKGINVDIFNGRDSKKQRKWVTSTILKTITEFVEHKRFDLVLVSVKHGYLEGLFLYRQLYKLGKILVGILCSRRQFGL